jgi:hypothetical protein
VQRMILHNGHRWGGFRLLVMFVAIACLLPIPLGGGRGLAEETPSSDRRETVLTCIGEQILPMHGSVSDFWFYAKDATPQLALMGREDPRIVVALDDLQSVELSIPIPVLEEDAPAFVTMQAIALTDRPVDMAVYYEVPGSPKSVETGQLFQAADDPGTSLLTIDLDEDAARRGVNLVLSLGSSQGAASVRLSELRLRQGDVVLPIAIEPQRREYPETVPVACSPPMHFEIEQAMIEWDWRLQDGLGASRESRTYRQAIKQTLDRGEKLFPEQQGDGVGLPSRPFEWTLLYDRYVNLLLSEEDLAEQEWETLWRDVHLLRREIALSNPLLKEIGPLLFVKRVPTIMSHQLTQCYGYASQPGGGLFVLEEPGQSMSVRALSESLPDGSCSRPEVSYDGEAIYFGFTPCDSPPRTWREPASMDRWTHLYAMDASGENLRQLTDGPYDDFSPIELPSGKLLFCSTRRGGFHRCGGGPCYVYTLAIAEADGSNPHPVSYHETNEWDPALLHDGRVLFTRWDYVDRDAVFYEHLWTVRQDGGDVRAYYGNNTFNPIGTWEARPVPGSNRIMATAAPHHGMSAGSIVLVDTNRGIEGLEPLTRLTPDALFPEAESGLFRGIPSPTPTRFDDPPPGAWGPQARSQAERLEETPPEELRWPGHCYKSPYPLSETYFLVSYSYDRLRGEPGPNRPNMFGLYLVDAFGNKELLYRDPNISSQWPMPLRPRSRPPVTETPPTWEGVDGEGRPEGTFFVQNVYESWPKLPDVEIASLRIIQVLPKTTPNANQPKVGAANASPGKQVLGTVPVESDGSIYFRAPAGTPVLFQALDAQNRAVQTMRSLTYLQPGEQSSCIGCHEPRTTTGVTQNLMRAQALGREPSTIEAGPDGSNPLSYPILVQPVLDRLCIACHTEERPDGDLILTGEPDGTFSRSYNGLIPHVAYSAWNAPNGNYEPRTEPDRFGARASRLVALLDEGHYDAKLTPDDWDRLVTWIDANALFYGTFNPGDQQRQLRGERIAGPDLE